LVTRGGQKRTQGHVLVAFLSDFSASLSCNSPFNLQVKRCRWSLPLITDCTCDFQSCLPVICLVFCQVLMSAGVRAALSAGYLIVRIHIKFLHCIFSTSTGREVSAGREGELHGRVYFAVSIGRVLSMLCPFGRPGGVFGFSHAA
jgi:hypothetical protein